MGKTTTGAILAKRELLTVTGAPVLIPDRERLVHLQLRRFAGCPICSLHLRSVVQRHDEIAAAGIREVVVFHSSADELLAYQPQTPFAMIGDPDKRLYREFGVESSPRALLDPRAWLPALRGVIGKRKPLAMDQHSGHLGLPAEFLIATDGRVLAAKYGTHAYDQWSVDELLDHAAAKPARSQP
jgi:hypothetical protein